MANTQDIEYLLGRVALRDRDAFEQLYTHTSAKLFGVCLRILNDRAEAEDALQEVYVKVWKRADTFAQRGMSPMSWLIAIARNQAIDVVRARKSETVELEEAGSVATQDINPEEQAISASEGRRIDECIEELDERHAVAVRRAYVHGNSYEELANHFDVPLNTMRTWLRRSLIKLKECLER